MDVTKRQCVLVNAPGELGRQVRGGLGSSSILLNRTFGTEGKDNRLQPIPYVAGGKREGVLVAFLKWTRYVRLQLAALLHRPLQSESIPRVEPEIAECEIDGSVVLRRTRLGDDLDPPPPRTRVFGRVRIIVDSDLLDFRCAKVVLRACQSVNDDGGARRPGGCRVQQSC